MGLVDVVVWILADNDDLDIVERSVSRPDIGAQVRKRREMSRTEPLPGVDVLLGREPLLSRSRLPLQELLQL